MTNLDKKHPHQGNNDSNFRTSKKPTLSALIKPNEDCIVVPSWSKLCLTSKKRISIITSTTAGPLN